MHYDEFTGRFEMLDTEESGRLSADSSEAFCRRVLIGWREIRTPEGDQVPYSEDVRDRLLRRPDIAVAVTRAYWQAMAGQEYKRKNSASSDAASPATGRPIEARL